MDKSALDRHLGITRIFPTDDVVVLVAQGLDCLNARRTFRDRWGIALQEDQETLIHGGIPKTSVFLLDEDDLTRLRGDPLVRRVKTLEEAENLLHSTPRGGPAGPRG